MGGGRGEAERVGSVPDDSEDDGDAGSRKFLYLLTGIASIGGALFGYDTGVVSGAMIQIKSDGDVYKEVGGFDLSSVDQELVVSMTIAGAAVGSLMSSPLNDNLGRRPVNILASVIFTAACVVMGVAPNLAVLVVGRTLVGVAVGFAATTVPMYIAESAPAQYRGQLVTVNNISIVLGQVAASLVDCALGEAKTPKGWRYMLGLGGVPAVVMFFGFWLILPESPRWLVQQGRIEDAADCLAKLRGRSNNDRELRKIQSAVLADKDNGSQSLGEMLSRRPVRRALVLGCGLQLLQQLVGINTLMYYSATILQSSDAGSGLAPADPKRDPWDSSNNEAICLSAATAAAQAVGCVIGMILVDRFGRRLLTLCSLAAVVVTLAILGLAFYGVPSHGDTSFPLAIGAMCMYLLAFGCGMSPMPWLVNAEIYPLDVRATCIAISTCVNWVSNFVVAFTFLDLAKAVSTDRENPKDHPDGAFFIYGCIGILGWIWLFFTMPETKGLPIEEIQALFDKPRPTSHSEPEGRGLLQANAVGEAS
eukprot:TRINITY_DN33121_c0_g1_i1.p1 TRINITY_DN33121_c0_g1~~TRINITY_DN33121_c0_g1_i1.p1  ORF type:complete len:534 (+),score=105.63 TRINITY_DN33121_c0_g1_i1:89-1690(+)